jgi:hypothetical protein
MIENEDDSGNPDSAVVPLMGDGAWGYDLLNGGAQIQSLPM